MLNEFERSPYVQEFSVASGGFLRLAVASWQDAFFLESQTKEHLSVIWKPWFSADSFWWTEFFLILRRKFLECRFFFSGALSVTLDMHTSTVTLLLHSRMREVRASKTVKGPEFCFSSGFFWSIELISCLAARATPTICSASGAGGWTVDWLSTLLQAPVPGVEVMAAPRVFVTLIKISNPGAAVGAGVSEETKKEQLKIFKSSEIKMMHL